MPKVYAHVEQGTADWFALRLGKPTASCFDQIVTPVKCDLSKSAWKYALRLCAERLLNMPTDTVEGVEWMMRGQNMEPDAVRQYEFTQEVKTQKVGFITDDSGRVGCSPDRIILDPSDVRAALEIKCPSPHVHLGYLLNGVADEYRPQVQGQIMIGELAYVDFYSFHPQCPPALIRTAADPDYIAKLAAALRQFCDNLDALEERARRLGVFQAMQHATDPFEADALARAYQEETREQMYRQGFAH